MAILAVLGVPHDIVQPASWKRRAGIPPGAGKGCSIATACRLLPAAAPQLTRVKDDGRAEALLLAWQAWERFSSGRGR
jgi:crossover junction endodeoxyribonuclease RuvC